MTTISAFRTLVLHGLRLKGCAESEAVAEAIGVPDADVKPELDRLVEDGLAHDRTGRPSGFTLTPAGRDEHLRLIAAELDAAGAHDSVRAGYGRFVTINPELLAVCTAWQLREVNGESVLNDHSDGDHDTAVIERLAHLDAAVQPICAGLAEALGRFGSYGARLGNALAHVRAGDGDWFTKPMIPSYHTVWFEFHEDLLVTLGMDRASEVPA